MKKLLLSVALSVFALTSCATTATPSAQTSPSSPNACGARSFAIDVKTIGTGANVILIPGLGSPPSVYDEIVAQNKDNYRFHMVHVAGYAGLASNQTEGSIFECAANGIADYLKSQRLNNATIIGHSMGGELAMAVNARNQGLVGKILVVDAFPFFSLLFGPNVTPDMMRPRALAFTQLVMGQSDAEFAAAQTVAIARLVKSDVHRARILGWSLASSRYAIAKGAEDLTLTDLRPELLQNKAKITMLYAYDAQMGLPQAYVDALYQNAYKDIPNTSLKRIDNSLHFIMYDQPQLFGEEVRSFLR